jgi:hypothetical protein
MFRLFSKPLSRPANMELGDAPVKLTRLTLCRNVPSGSYHLEHRLAVVDDGDGQGLEAFAERALLTHELDPALTWTLFLRINKLLRSSYTDGESRGWNRSTCLCAGPNQPLGVHTDEPSNLGTFSYLSPQAR